MYTNEQIHLESTQILYGLNTFYVDISTMWDSSAARGFKALKIEQAEHPFICLLCTPSYHLSSSLSARRRAHARLPPRSRSPPGRQYHSSWMTTVASVRRLHISLRPHTYHQWRLHCLWPLGGIFSQSRPVQACQHSFQEALPLSMRLELLITHIGKPALTTADDDRDGGYTFLYPKDQSEWLLRLSRDLAREVGWLVTFARSCAKAVVIPQAGQADPRDAVARLEKLRKARGDHMAHTITSTIPSWALRAGQLAHLSRNGYHERWEPATYVKDYDREAGARIVETADAAGHELLLQTSQALIYDSVPGEKRQ